MKLKILIIADKTNDIELMRHSIDNYTSLRVQKFVGGAAKKSNKQKLENWRKEESKEVLIF